MAEVIATQAYIARCAECEWKSAVQSRHSVASAEARAHESIVHGDHEIGRQP